jgi:restriction system protein
VKPDLLTKLSEAVAGWGVPLLLSLLAGLFILKLFYARIKGGVGEWRVNRMLRGLPAEKYRVLPNLLIPDGIGGLTQIDHLVVSRFGLFVIETKNWDGWVFGSEKEAKWKITYRGGARSDVPNPLRQNWGHAQAVLRLVEVLGVAPSSVHNVVFLSPQATLKKGPIPGVVQQGLCAHLMGYREHLMSDDVVDQVAGVLERVSLSSDAKAVARHRSEIRKR